MSDFRHKVAYVFPTADVDCEIGLQDLGFDENEIKVFEDWTSSLPNERVKIEEVAKESPDENCLVFIFFKGR